MTAALLAFGLAACKDTASINPSRTDTATTSQSVVTGGPASIPIRTQLSCLPKEAAFVAAHRGTSKKENLPENAGSSMKALIKHGIMVAEIDVAGLKDGTHILFHDGVWEDESTGKGVVAATYWDEAKDFLLRDTDGDYSADRPIKLEDALAIAKDKLYLEVDFKSSAKYDHVIKAIRDADMQDQVILISYNDKQASKLARMAPEMMLSVGAKSEGAIKALKRKGVKPQNMAVWMGGGPYEDQFMDYLNEQNIPVLAWPKEGARKSALDPATIAVTDYALQKRPIEGLSRNARETYNSCLQNSSPN